MGPISTEMNSILPDTLPTKLFEYDFSFPKSIGTSIGYKDPSSAGIIQARLIIPKNLKHGTYNIKATGKSYDYKNKRIKDLFTGKYRCVYE